MKALALKALDLLRYPSTYKGILALLGVAGVTLAPDKAEAISTAGIALYGAISLFFSDADVKPTPVAKKK